MSRVRIRHGQRKFWTVYDPAQAIGDLGKQIRVILGIDEDLNLSLDGFELLGSLPCSILRGEDIIDVAQADHQPERIVIQPQIIEDQIREQPALKRRKLSQQTERLAAVPVRNAPTDDTGIPLVFAPPLRRSQRQDVSEAERLVNGNVNGNSARKPTAMEEDEQDGSFKAGDKLSDDENFTEVDTDEDQGGVDFDKLSLEELAALLRQQDASVALPPAAVVETVAEIVIPPPIQTEQIIPSSPKYFPGSPIPAVITPPATTNQPDSEDDRDFVPGRMPIDSDATSSSGSDSSEEPVLDSAEIVRRHMKSISRQPPSTQHLSEPKSGLEMPILYHPDLVKPEFHWVSVLVGYSPDEFPQLRKVSPQPDHIGLQDIPNGKAVIDWVNQEREGEVSGFLEALRLSQEQNKREALASQLPNGGASTSKLPIPVQTQASSSSEESSSEESSSSSSSSESSSSSDSSDSDSSEEEVASIVKPNAPVISAHSKKESTAGQRKMPIQPGTGQTATQSRNARRRRKAAAVKAQAIGGDAATAPSRPTSNTIDASIQEAKLQAMKALDDREEQDLKMYALQTKNKNKKKQKNYQSLNGNSKTTDFGFNGLSRPVPPPVPSARSDLPSNVIVTFVDVEAPDWEPGHTFTRTAGGDEVRKKQEVPTETDSDEWQGWMSLEQVARQWPLLARVKDARDLKKGDALAFQLIELDYTTSAPEFATYFGKITEDPAHASEPDSNLIPTTPYQASATKETSTFTIKLHPTSVRENWEDSEGATEEADVKVISFDKFEDPRRPPVRRPQK